MKKSVRLLAVVVVREVLYSESHLHQARCFGSAGSQGVVLTVDGRSTKQELFCWMLDVLISESRYKYLGRWLFVVDRSSNDVRK